MKAEYQKPEPEKNIVITMTESEARLLHRDTFERANLSNVEFMLICVIGKCLKGYTG